jgi:tetratricopeptide (TPR) repeat protein
MTRATLAVFLVSMTCPVYAQTKSAVDQWVQKTYEATERYRSGDFNGAVALLGTMTREEQVQVVDAIGDQIDRMAHGWPPSRADVVPWPTNVVRALGALHMDAAIAARASRERDSIGTAAHHIALAKSVFAMLFVLIKHEEHSLERWLLVIALEDMSNAQFRRASTILAPACEEHKEYAPLLLACGSIHETYSSFPADHGVPLSGDDLRRMTRLPSTFVTTLSYSAQTLSRATAARKYQLGLARKYLQRAVALDPKDAEAPLRLANVHVQQGDLQDAARILEGLLARPFLDERQSYLARLFLARVRDRENRLEDAAAILAKAQPIQSALLARAHNAIRRGNTKEAALFAERASHAALDDPWWGYRFGQFWVPDDLYKQLREEARK